MAKSNFKLKKINVIPSAIKKRKYKDLTVAEMIQLGLLGSRSIVSQLPIFDMPLINSLTAGVGELDSFSRTGGGTVTDNEGFVFDVVANEARFHGARRCKNVLSEWGAITSEWFDIGAGSGWTAILDAACTNNVFTASQNTARIQLVATDYQVNSGEEYTISLTVDSITLTGDSSLNVYMYDGTNLQLAFTINSNVTERTRFSGTVTLADSTTLPQLQLRLANTSGTITANLVDVQCENVSGKENQFASEYISFGLPTEPEIFPNNSFDTDIGTVPVGEGSVGDLEWYKFDAQAAITWSAGSVRVENSDASSALLQIKVPTRIGALYAISVDMGAVTGQGAIKVGTTNGATDLVNEVAIAANKSRYATFRATTTTTYISFPNNDAVLGNYATYNEIRIGEISHGSNVDGVKSFSNTNRNYMVAFSNVLNEYAAGNLQPNHDFSESDSSQFGTINSGWEWPAHPNSYEIANGGLNVIDAGPHAMTSKFDVPPGVKVRFRYTINDTAVQGVALFGTTTDPLTAEPYPFSVGTHEVIKANPFGSPNSSVFGLFTNGKVANNVISDISVELVWTIDSSVTKGVLVEAESTNLIVNSEDFGAAGWGSSNTVVDADNVVCPDGVTRTTNALRATAANGNRIQFHGGQVQTLSCYVRSKTLTGTLRFVQIGGLGQTSGDLASQVNGDTWTRLTWSAATAQSATSWGIEIGNSGDEVEVWGFQTENLTYATSYIPTLGASASRNAEILKYATPLQLRSTDVEGMTMYAEFNERTRNINSVYGLYVADSSGDAAILGSSAGSKNLSHYYDTANQIINSAGDYGNADKVANSYDKVVGHRFVVNGSQELLDPTVNPPLQFSGVTIVYVGGNNTNLQIGGCVKNAKLWDNVISQTMLESITS